MTPNLCGPTRERLLECFEYNPESGLLLWKQRPRSHFARREDWTRFNADYAGKVAGWTTRNGYLQVQLDGRKMLVHRVAWFLCTGEWPEGDVDHFNGNRKDNRWANLREITRSENLQNQTKPRSNNTSGYLGVSRLPSGAWTARIRIPKEAGGGYPMLGVHKTPEAAHAAYLKAKALWHPKAFLSKAAQ